VGLQELWLCQLLGHAESPSEGSGKDWAFFAALGLRASLSRCPHLQWQRGKLTLPDCQEP